MQLLKLAVCSSAVAILAGCALGRDVVDVATPQTSNPASGKQVRIEQVLDKREFQVAPPSADIASLDADQGTGPEVEARAIGRKRGSFGKAFGDIVLPEGKTVSGLVEGAVSTAFKESGYVVLSKGDVGYDQATPVNARVVEFWAWFAPGFWAVSTNHKSEIELSGASIPQPSLIKTRVSESKQVVTSDDWREIVEKGLAAITEQTKKLLTSR